MEKKKVLLRYTGPFYPQYEDCIFKVQDEEGDWVEPHEIDFFDYAVTKMTDGAEDFMELILPVGKDFIPGPQYEVVD